MPSRTSAARRCRDVGLAVLLGASVVALFAGGLQAQVIGRNDSESAPVTSGKGTQTEARGQTESPTYDGAALFKTWCASCHGVTADGTGPLAPQLKSRVPDLTQIAEKNGGTFPVARIRRIIDGREVGAHGNPDMPIWGTAFKSTKDGFSEASVRARIDAIVRYLETIQRRNAQ